MNGHSSMKKLPLLFVVLSVAVSGWLVYLLLGTSPWSTFSEQGSQLMAMEWGRISLVDLYAGFFLGLVFVWFLETKLWVKLLVTVTLPTLGNPVLAIWLIFRLKQLQAVQDFVARSHLETPVK
jgi:hypothetical protein